MKMRFIAVLVLSTALASPALAIDDAVHDELKTQLTALQQKVASLDIRKRVDAEVCAKAVEWILRHDEFYKPNFIESARKTLTLGHERAEQISRGNENWGTLPGVHALAYRSRVDTSVQPYLVTLPEDFELSGAKRWPLYVVLHGRNATLTEAHFIATGHGKPAPQGQSWIQLDVFGRTNNAYRWAGETDVFEAIADVSRRYRIDESRVTLWGFSMGGAGAWHLGLHHPSRWASVGAGAGFVDFYKYQNQSDQLPDHQHKALRIYDAKDYVLNLNVVPFVTYGGEKDPQLLASLTIQEEAKQLNVPLQLIVGPNMGHKFDDESKARFMEFLAKHNQPGRQKAPGLRDFQFVTYTLKYNTCESVTIEEQVIPYARTTITSSQDDQGILRLHTENVAALSVLRSAADRVRIDDSEPLELNLASDANLTEVFFIKENSSWQALDYDDSLEFTQNPERHKRHNLQGPIDDAFMEGFVCVRGTSQPWSKNLEDYAQWSLQRFSREYDKWMRATVPMINDVDLNEELIRSKNLILFGDPGSNSILNRIVGDLPLRWDQNSITFAETSYSTKDHAVALIFPNPLNPQKYVVINSGMTMHEKDFKASNSWLFPKLGDHAVIQFAAEKEEEFSEKVVKAGLFDAHWNK